MSKVEVSFRVAAPVDRTQGACRVAVSGEEWTIVSIEPTKVKCKENRSMNLSELLSFTFVAEIEIDLRPADKDSTEVTMRGSGFGFGPIQTGHVTDKVQTLRNRIELALANETQRTSSAPSSDLSGEIVKLAELHARGVLSTEEFRLAKEKLLQK